MEYRNLHLRDGVKLASRLSFGCEPLGGVDWGRVDIEEIKRALSKSIELGWNFIDTAAIYGLGASERHVGEIAKYNSNNTLVATKIGMEHLDSSKIGGRATILRTLNPVILEKQIEASLKRLNMSYLPIVYLHHPDQNFTPAELTKSIGSWINTGIIGGYGLSNFTLEDIKSFHDLLPVSAVQFECSMLDAEMHAEVRQKVDWCRKNHILTVAYGVLKKGLLSGKYGLTEPSFDQNDRRSRLEIFNGIKYLEYIDQIQRIKKIINNKNYQFSSVGIRYILDVLNIDVAIIGIKSLAHLIENHESVYFRLAGNEVKAINRVLKF
jgi:aryl-alcohol dehydrogenase-like predicted oxidoreductase